MTDNGSNAVTLTIGNNNSTGMTYSGSLSGAGSLVKTGTGAQTLSGSMSTFSGGTTISSGKIILTTSSIGAAGAVTSGPLGTGTITITNGILVGNLNTGVTLNNNLNFSGTNGVLATVGSLNGSSQGGNLTLGGAWSGSGTAVVGTESTGLSATISVSDNLSGFNGTVKFVGGLSSLSFTNALNTSAKFVLSGSTDQQSLKFANGSSIGELSGTGGLIQSNASASSTLTINQATKTSYTGNMADTVYNGATRLLSITKSGTGTLSLGGVNSNTGAYNVNGGTLQFARTSALYNSNTANWTAAKINVASGATIAFNVDTSGTGGFTAANITTLITNIDRAVNNNGLKAGSTIAFDTSTATGGTFTISDSIQNTTGTGGGAVGLTKLGAGVLILANASANTYTGTTTVTAGELDLNSSVSNGAVGGDIAVNGGVLKLLGNNQIADTSTAVISSGTLDFNGKNETIKNLTNSGGTVLYSGTIKITDPLCSGGTNTVSGNVTFGELTVSAGANTVNAGGVLTVGGASDETTGDSDLTFSGTSSPNITLLSGGKLVLAGNVTVKSDLTEGTASITTDSQSSPGQLDLGGTTRTFTMNGTSGTNMIISAQIINGGLTKAGAGLLELSGNNTYEGATSVTAGTLQVSGTLQSTASVSVSAGARFNVNGLVNTSALVSLSGTLSGSGTVGAVNATGGTVSPGNNNNGILNTKSLSLDATSHLSIQMGRTADGGGTLSNSQVNVTGSVTLASGADLQLSITTGQYNPITGDIIYLVVNDGTDSVNGVFTKLNGVTTTLSEGSDFDYNGVTYQITYTANAEAGSYTGGNDIALEVVPEPGTWGMILSGFGMLIGIQRLRKRRVGI